MEIIKITKNNTSFPTPPLKLMRKSVTDQFQSFSGLKF